ncbi:hypothetical protein BJ994_003344 [Arthrobacter pigmenti]|uniref:Uncharacterized protein n=1 Tax=Arthrobacter pigmenti TaxID=271432 RepID=A0A846RLJ7_9MICC|nr:hypothetical protein [Arthrobacter pigmenti]NJC24268.1 hypothetical protein [Arthrobacter pigmenti]
MEPFEVTIEQEVFCISERRQPTGNMSYDFLWLNGPVEGYGYTVALSHPDSRMSREELVDEVRGFLQGFYEPGGIGEEDFPDHGPTAGR